jgi:hypothetical protein
VDIGSYFWGVFDSHHVEVGDEEYGVGDALADDVD